MTAAIIVGIKAAARSSILIAQKCGIAIITDTTMSYTGNYTPIG